VSAGFLILVIVLFGLGWLLVIRPQKRKQLVQQELLDSVEVGMEILTAGGLYATVVEADEDELTVELAPGIQVLLDRRAVAAVMPPAEPEEAQEPEQVTAGGQPNGENRS
jgi:preprotein translocase subunit YajC